MKTIGWLLLLTLALASTGAAVADAAPRTFINTASKDAPKLKKPPKAFRPGPYKVKKWKPFKARKARKWFR